MSESQIVVFNAGSSSLKSGVFQIAPEPVQLSTQNQALDLLSLEPREVAGLVSGIFDKMRVQLSDTAGGAQIAAVGHRVVHGGPRFTTPLVVCDSSIEALSALGSLAPLHNPSALKVLEAARRVFPFCPHVAVFDTAYHATIREESKVYPLPWSYYADRGFRRYGFHGISHKYCAEKSCRLLSFDHAAARIVTCHLGNGASLAATAGGACLDTTMGYTPLEGLMMGTRSGSVDPGIILELLSSGMPSEDLNRVLNHESGLAGVSGVSKDMRQVLEAAGAGNSRAALAVDMFCHRVASGVASMAVSAGGIDILAFTGGIGEHATEIRTRVCRRLAFLGANLDEDLNAQSMDRVVSTPDSAVKIVVVEAREELEIAKQCLSILSLPR